MRAARAACLDLGVGGVGPGVAQVLAHRRVQQVGAPATTPTISARSASRRRRTSMPSIVTRPRWGRRAAPPGTRASSCPSRSHRRAPGCAGRDVEVDAVERGDVGAARAANPTRSWRQWQSRTVVEVGSLPTGSGGASIGLDQGAGTVEQRGPARCGCWQAEGRALRRGDEPGSCRSIVEVLARRRGRRGSVAAVRPGAGRPPAADELHRSRARSGGRRSAASSSGER